MWLVVAIGVLGMFGTGFLATRPGMDVTSGFILGSTFALFAMIFGGALVTWLLHHP